MVVLMVDYWVVLMAGKMVLLLVAMKAGYLAVSTVLTRAASMVVRKAEL